MDEEYEEYEESWTGRIAIAAVVALALIAGAFFAGRAMADGGPATLAEAVQQAQAGDLPCGDSPAATPSPGGPPPGNGGFMVLTLCDRGAQQNTARGRGRAGGGPGFGQTVVSVKGSTLTLEGPGGNREVQLGPETTVSTTAKGAAADLKAGQSVIVTAQGQGTATSVLILPAGAGAG
jgi:hypothetical protein